MLGSLVMFVIKSSFVKIASCMPTYILTYIHHKYVHTYIMHHTYLHKCMLAYIHHAYIHHTYIHASNTHACLHTLCSIHASYIHTHIMRYTYTHTYMHTIHYTSCIHYSYIHMCSVYTSWCCSCFIALQTSNQFQPNRPYCCFHASTVVYRYNKSIMFVFCKWFSDSLTPSASNSRHHQP